MPGKSVNVYLDYIAIRLTTHHLHPKPTKTLANATFNMDYAEDKNGSALGVGVNAIVRHLSSFLTSPPSHYCGNIQVIRAVLPLVVKVDIVAVRRGIWSLEL